MSQVTILRGEPTIIPIAEMSISPLGLEQVMEWVKDHRPECLPEQAEGELLQYQKLFPHDLQEHTTTDFRGEQVPQVRGLTSNELLVEFAGRKCIAQGSIVETTNGPKRIEDVQVGDHVVVLEGQFPVVAVSNNGMKDVVAVESEDGYAVVCTPDHLLLTEEGWVEASALRHGDVLKLGAGVSEWAGEGTFEEGFACGLFLGDGTFAGEGFRVASLRLFGSKMGLMSFVESIAGGKAIPHREGQALSLNSKAWGDRLAAFGIVRGARRVTPAVELASSAFQRGVLMGLWDTDGSLENNKKTRRAYYCSSDLVSLGAVQRMLLRFGIFSRLRLDRTAQEHLVIQGVSTVGKPSYKLTVTGDSFRRFAEVIGSRRRAESLRLAADRTQKKSPSVVFGKVRAVHPFGSATVYDLSIGEGSPHSFVANGIVVHNCYDSFGLRAGKKSNREYIANTQSGDIAYSSILYHAKMTFFFAGISRRVSHELIRNYVGSDRDEEGAPSQESTRFTHHYGFFIEPPKYGLPEDMSPGRILDDSAEQHNANMQGHFKRSMQLAYDNYLSAVEHEVAAWTKRHGKPPTSMDKKRIYEAASSFLPHQAETSMVWTCNVASVAKFVRERAHPGSDLEIQRFAKKLGRVCLERWPNLFSFNSWAKEL